MHPRLSAPLFCAALAVCAHAQEAAPLPAFVTAVQGQTLTLGIGAETGAQLGALYQITRGQKSVRVQITQVRARDASAQIVPGQTNPLALTVGDSATFVALAPPQTPAAPAAAAPAAPANAAAPAEAAQPLPPAPPAIQTPAAQAPADTPAAPPAQVLVTGFSGPDGKDVMLGAGLTTGIKLGAVYVMPARGEAQARLIVVEVSAQSARARLLTVGDGFVPTVGETARFVGIEAVPAELLPAPAPHN